MMFECEKVDILVTIVYWLYMILKTINNYVRERAMIWVC